MQAFAALLDRLYFAHSSDAKAAILCGYLRRTPDPDRGFAVGAIAGALNFKPFTPALARKLVVERVDPVLLALSCDYVGGMSETIAHVWPRNPRAVLLNRLPPLHEVIREFQTRDKAGVREYLALLLGNMTAAERWALLKLGTQTLRTGMSPHTVKQVLAAFGGVDTGQVEEVWHAQEPPYLDLFAWLEGRSAKPDCTGAVTFHPVMLAHAIGEAEVESITPAEFMAEWKYDGIRVQVVSSPAGKALFSRTGGDISGVFPEVLACVDLEAVLDGELIVKDGGGIASFGHLQRRLSRKSPDAKLIAACPGHLILYDALAIGGRDLRPLPLMERKAELARWFEATKPASVELAQPLAFRSPDDLRCLRAQADAPGSPHIEGLMLKRLDSPYIAGRPKSLWYKWRRDPNLINAVLMYAQRGAGKDAAFYSSFTFGLWREGALSPIGKVDGGLTDGELKELGEWARSHAVQRFGPVLEVEKALVCEVAFDAVYRSARHKSGVALRSPRINRIRWNKPAREADELASLAKWLG